jgi:hypothetical protein
MATGGALLCPGLRRETTFGGMEVLQGSAPVRVVIADDDEAFLEFLRVLIAVSPSDHNATRAAMSCSHSVTRA